MSGGCRAVVAAALLLCGIGAAADAPEQEHGIDAVIADILAGPDYRRNPENS